MLGQPSSVRPDGPPNIAELIQDDHAFGSLENHTTPEIVEKDAWESLRITSSGPTDGIVILRDKNGPGRLVGLERLQPQRSVRHPARCRQISLAYLFALYDAAARNA